MAKFRYNCAAGDNSAGDRKVNWTTDTMLQAPPREVFDLLNRATACGYWLKWAKCPRVLSLWGSRYKITRAGSIATVFASDDLADIEAFVRDFET